MQLLFQVTFKDSNIFGVDTTSGLGKLYGSKDLTFGTAASIGGDANHMQVTVSNSINN